ncbi:MAG: hypothetical protein KA369_05725 [Spirochaetes bacterium]|nr:hypothetical protein [Spirochaetota bacterium]
MIKLFKKIHERVQNRRALLQECMDFCVKHNEFITSIAKEPQTEEEILSGFQKLLDAGLLFKIDFYYSLMGRGLLQRGLILIKDGNRVYDSDGKLIIVDKME